MENLFTDKKAFQYYQNFIKTEFESSIRKEKKLIDELITLLKENTKVNPKSTLKVYMQYSSDLKIDYYKRIEKE
jgi:hypothetical protein